MITYNPTVINNSKRTFFKVECKYNGGGRGVFDVYIDELEPDIQEAVKVFLVKPENDYRDKQCKEIKEWIIGQKLLNKI